MAQQIMDLQEVSMEGFQVVSGSMFSHFPKTSEPSCTLWYSSISFSKSAVSALNGCDRVLIQVNAKSKGILIVPVSSKDKDGILWLKDSKIVQAKKMDCKLFTSQLYETWGFDPEYVYRSYGRLVTSDKKVMLLFEFNRPESWKCRTKKEENKDG
jgi:hypothetical protein